jgi:hypothetical protein
MTTHLSYHKDARTPEKLFEACMDKIENVFLYNEIPPTLPSIFIVVLIKTQFHVSGIWPPCCRTVPGWHWSTAPDNF